MGPEKAAHMEAFSISVRHDKKFPGYTTKSVLLVLIYDYSSPIYSETLDLCIWQFDLALSTIQNLDLY